MNSAPERPAPDRIGILLRVALFIIIGWLGMIVFPRLMLILGSGIMVASTLSVFAAAAVANAVAVRVYERGSLSDLGLGWAETSGREFLIGIAAGIVAAVVMLIGPIATRAATFERAPGVEHPLPSFVFVALVLLFGAAGEEMLFHGYAFQLLIRTLGAFATILPAGVLFGIMHAGNPNSTFLGVANTMLWGVLLGYAYLRTRALWLPIGLHFGWNVALPFFGANLSGFTMGLTGYALDWRVGNLWSGGAYGPEGSVLTTVVVIALFFVVRRVTEERDLSEDGGA